MSSKLLFTQSSPLDTKVVYETTGHPLYEIETENGTIQKTTVVRKLDLNRGGEDVSHAKEEIARIHWNMVISDEVTFQGRTMTKDKFIHKTGSGPEGCYTTHAQGVEYQWIRRDPSDGFSKLVKSGQEQILIAQFHRSVQSPPPDLKDAFLEVSSEGNIILDHVLVSFIFIEKELRDRDRSPRRSPDPLPKPS